MLDQISKYNNIFNKKNIEYTLDGAQDRLPYTAENDVKLKANQIIFTAINNVFQRLLDNDLYNEAILKKYIEYGLIGGPTYISSVNQVEDSAFLNKKFVVSGENGISVLRKEEVDVSDTLSGRFLDGTKVNRVTFVGERYVACTENGVYESLDKANWTRRVGQNGVDVVDIDYNQNFLNGGAISAYDYIAIANSGSSAIFYGHDGTNGYWRDFSASPELSATSIDGVTATSIFSFAGDPLLYVGTKAKGLLASTLLNADTGFAPELGTDRWTVYDMAEVPNVDSYENYFLATNYGIKQSRKEYGFKNFRNPTSFNFYVYDALKDGGAFYICTGEGLLFISHTGEQRWNAALRGKSCYTIAKNGNGVYVGAQDGVYILKDMNAIKIGLDGKNIQKLASLNSAIFAYDPELRKIVYSKNNSAFAEFSLTFDEDEAVKQLKQNQNALYVLTNKAIYAIVDGDVQQMFMWAESFASNGDVYFAQNLPNGNVAVQVGSALYVLTEGSAAEAQISVELEDPISKVSAAAVSGNDYFFLIDGKLYRLFSDGEGYVLNAVVIDQMPVLATKIAFYNDNATFKGLVLLDSNGEIKLLQYDNAVGALLPISGIEKFDDLAVYKDGIYALSSSQSQRTITKYSPVDQLALNEVAPLTADNGVALQQYTGEGGVVENRSLIGNVYLSTFADSISFRLQNGLEEELTAFADLTATAADFIGYIPNSDRKKTLLAGIENGSVKGYNVGFDSALTAISSIEEVSVKDSPQNPTVFADASYRNQIGITVNAMNFVGAEDGLYAISATKQFVEEAIPDSVSKVNDALVVENAGEVTTYIGADSGVYQFYTSDPKNFIDAGYTGEVKTLSKLGRSIIANGNGNDVLVSSTFGDTVEWKQLFDSATTNDSFTTLSTSEEQVLIESNLSSNGGNVLMASPKTVSKDASSESMLALLNNVLSCSIAGNLLPSELSSIYKENGTVKAGDVFGNVYTLSFSSLPDGSVSIAPSLIADAPKEISSILVNGMANDSFLEKNISIAIDPDLNPENLETTILSVVLPPYVEQINEIDSVSLQGVSSVSLHFGTIGVDDWNYESYLYCLNPILSSSFNLSNSGVSSLNAVERIEANVKFLSTSYAYELMPVWLIDDDGEYYQPTNDTGAVSVVVSPDGKHSVDIYQDQYLSEWIQISASSEPVLSTIALLSTYSITESNSVAVLSDTNAVFASALSSMPLNATSSAVSYDVSLSISDVSYRSDFSEPISPLSLDYFLSISLENTRQIVKTLPLVNETRDGIYYDKIYWNSETLNGSIEKKYLAGYCLSTMLNDSPLWLMLTEDSIYAFDKFNVDSRKELIGFTQISKSNLNDSFNDLYYFRIGENFNEYAIRKTNISDHGKDFSKAKYSIDAGNTLSILLEGENALYAIKRANSGELSRILYYTTSSIFPEFKQAEHSQASDSLYGLASCSDYTIAIYPSGGGLVAEAYQQGNMVRSDLPIVSDASKYKGVFSDSSNVYIALDDGIYHFSDVLTASGLDVKDSDFSLQDGVKCFFTDDSAYHSEIVIGDAYLYAKENLYDFKDGGYVKLPGFSERIVDLKVLSANTPSPVLYAATLSDIYQCKIAGFDTDSPVLHNKEKKSEGAGFSNVKAIYFNRDNDLYVLDGADLYVYEDFAPNKQLSDCVSSVNFDFLSGSFIDKATINDFGQWMPAIVKKDSANDIGWTRRIVKQQTQTVPSVEKFIDGLGESKYLYSPNKVQTIASEYGEESFTIEDVGTFDSGLIDSNTAFIDDSSALQTKLLGLNKASNAIKEKILSSDSTPASYPIAGHPTINSIFKAGVQICLGASGNGPGVYRLGSITGYKLNDDDGVVAAAKSIGESKELFAMDFFGEDYLISYIDESIPDNEGNAIRRSLIKSSNSSYQDYMNSSYVSNIGAVALASLFNRYIFVSDGAQGYVYDVHSRKGSKILFSQLEQAAGGLVSLTFLKESGGLGLLGYGSAFGIFDGFSNVKIYDDIDYAKYVTLANNFKRGVQKIEVLNEKPDFLIGTTYGLKYVYDDMMTRSFYNRDSAIAISEPVNTIEKVIDASNDEFFIVGSGSSLYEVTSLKNATFRKIFDFGEGETVLDVFALQKNEYVIATTKGIYTTALTYKLTNDLRRFTLDSIYEVINDELKKIIADHIAAEHNPDSIVTKVNGKADNKLSFVSDEDKHKDVYDPSIANAVRVVENDIIDTIVRGGESPDAESYVKVGIKNWAVGSLDPEATYTDDGFVNAFTDANSGKRFDISVVPYIVKNWKSGLKEIYIYVPSTGTYYANNPQGISNSQYSYNAYQRPNVPNASLLNTLPNACTTLRVYLYNSYFKIKTILAAQCTGNSLPLKIYKDNVNADDAWKGVFDTVVQPSALRTLPMTVDSSVNNVRICTDDLERIYLDFSIYGTDAQAIRIIAES